MQNAHRDAATEEDDSGGDQQWCKEPHRELRRAFQSVGLVSRVVTREAPARARELQEHRRNQDEADENMERQELVQAEEERRQFNERENDQDESDGRGQALVSVRIHAPGGAARPLVFHAYDRRRNLTVLRYLGRDSTHSPPTRTAEA